MKKIFSSNFWISIAIFLGIAASFLPIPHIETIAKTIADLFINLLKLISLPIIFFSIVSTITKMESLKEAGYLLKKVLKYTLFTTIIAATVGLGLFLFIHPSAPQEIGSATAQTPPGSYLSFLMKIVPSNPIQAFLEYNVLGVAFMAALLSIAIVQMPKKYKESVAPFFQSMFQVLLKISSWIIRFIPIGVFGFTYFFVKNLKTSQGELKSLLLYMACVIGANLIQGLIVLPLILKSRGISPLRTFKAMSPALITAFFSKSSSATLPIALENAEKRLKVPGKISSFSLPLCSVINMNGCAAFILITVLFVAMSSGIVFSPIELIAWVFISTLAAIGNAGVPMGCYFLTGALLTGMKVPLYLLGLILPIYTLFDMLETALNVWSDSSVTTLVAKEVTENQEVPAKT